MSTKRLRTNDILSPTVNQEKFDPNQSLSSALKELNHGVDQLRKQIVSLTNSCDQH